MIKKSICLLLAIIVGLVFSHGVTFAAGPFEDKTVRIIVGMSAGGGFDASIEISKCSHKRNLHEL